MLRAVLYLSDSTFEDQIAEQQQLNAIRDFSTKENKNKGITGVLAYQKQKFLHLIEGEYLEIDSLLKKITADPRSKNISIALDINPQERVYNNWDAIDSHDHIQSSLFGKFLHNHIDMLPLLKQDQHDLIEEFINKIFY